MAWPSVDLLSFNTRQLLGRHRRKVGEREMGA